MSVELVVVYNTWNWYVSERECMSERVSLRMSEWVSEGERVRVRVWKWVSVRIRVSVSVRVGVSVYVDV